MRYFAVNRNGRVRALYFKQDGELIKVYRALYPDPDKKLLVVNDRDKLEKICLAINAINSEAFRVESVM